MSTDGRTGLAGIAWLPDSPARPRGVVQIAHGMAEHIARYDGFARFLAGEGYAVCGIDHLGHGKSSDPGRYGKLPAKEGARYLVEDQHKVRELMAARFAGVPYFAFGHSLGSYIMRAYIARHGEGLAGCVLCGTGYIAPAISRAGHALAILTCKKNGEDACSAMLDGMGAGGYNKGIANPRTPVDWLSHDAGNVDAYIADPACGFMFSAGGYAVVTELTAQTCARSCFGGIPRDLPILFIAGEEDPVGDCGKGVRKVCKLMREAGVADVECKLYAGMRHEILNEAEHRAVYRDVAEWLDAHAR